MALSKTFEIQGCYQFAHSDGLSVTEADATLSVEDAYIVVHSVSGTKGELKATVHIRSGDLAVTRFYVFTPSVDDGSDNFIKQAYEHLKTLPEFSGAIDC